MPMNDTNDRGHFRRFAGFAFSLSLLALTATHAIAGTTPNADDIAANVNDHNSRVTHNALKNAAQAELKNVAASLTLAKIEEGAKAYATARQTQAVDDSAKNTTEAPNATVMWLASIFVQQPTTTQGAADSLVQKRPFSDLVSLPEGFATLPHTDYHTGKVKIGISNEGDYPHSPVPEGRLRVRSYEVGSCSALKIEALDANILRDKVEQYSTQEKGKQVTVDIKGEDIEKAYKLVMETAVRYDTLNEIYKNGLYGKVDTSNFNNIKCGLTKPDLQTKDLLEKNAYAGLLNMMNANHNTYMHASVFGNAYLTKQGDLLVIDDNGKLVKNVKSTSQPKP